MFVKEKVLDGILLSVLIFVLSWQEVIRCRRNSITEQR